MGGFNLPPGCSSPDGGIDHEFEAALDKLLDVALTPNVLEFFTAITPAVNEALNRAYNDGFTDGQIAKEQEFEYADGQA